MIGLNGSATETPKMTRAERRRGSGENNFRNRPLSEDVIAAYARDMTNKKWVPTHQGIAFNDCDELIDGQHRLHAIVRSGVTIRMMVTFRRQFVIEEEKLTMHAVLLMAVEALREIDDFVRARTRRGARR